MAAAIAEEEKWSEFIPEEAVTSRRAFCALLLFVLLAPLSARGEGAEESSTAVLGVRQCLDKDSVRLVLDCSSRPLCQVYQSDCSREIVVDIFEAGVAPDLPLGAEASDSLIKGWEFSQVNFRQVSWKIKLKYGLPSDNIKVFMLREPDRLVIDILRNFSIVSSYPLTRNVEWVRKETGDSDGYLLLNELKINLKSPDILLSAALANDDVKSRETTSSIVSRKAALAGVNGGFFARGGGPLGLVLMDGELKAPPVAFRPPRTVIGMSGEKRVYMSRLGLKDGKLADMDGKEPPALFWALGGGPRVLSGGTVAIMADEEALGKGGNDITRPAGRCAVGTLGEDRLLILTATGFSNSNRQGPTLPKLATLMQEEGALDAMCLDGGDSTNMVIRGDVVSNGPAVQGPERKVGSALLIYDGSPELAPASISVKAPSSSVADGESQVSVRMTVADASGRPVADSTPVNLSASWGLLPPQVLTKGGGAEFSFIALRRCAIMDITARAGKAVQNFSINFVPAQATILAGKVTASQSAESGESCLLLEVLVRDRFFNPVAQESVSFEIKGGTGRLDGASAVTGDDGVARVRYYPLSDISIVVASCRDLKPVTFTCAPPSPQEDGGASLQKSGGTDQK
ncbi:MAG: phosphodiester glycosidase family protein [bacterium]